MSNRVEELESRVAELQAAVDGLTEELVETRERLRQLESAQDIEVSRTPERRGLQEATEEDVEGALGETDEAPDEGADAASETETEAETEADAESESDTEDSDIIVA